MRRRRSRRLLASPSPHSLNPDSRNSESQLESGFSIRVFPRRRSVGSIFVQHQSHPTSQSRIVIHIASTSQRDSFEHRNPLHLASPPLPSNPDAVEQGEGRTGSEAGRTEPETHGLDRSSEKGPDDRRGKNATRQKKGEVMATSPPRLPTAGWRPLATKKAATRS